MRQLSLFADDKEATYVKANIECGWFLLQFQLIKKLMHKVSGV